jgi:hypothetical protein
MPRINLQEISGDKPVTGIAEDISVAILNVKRGRINYPDLAVGFGQAQSRWGNYDTNSYCMYELNSFFTNGGRNLYGIRVVGGSARYAGGADADKIATSKAQLIYNAATPKELRVQANTKGVDGTLANLTIETAVADDKTTVAVANSYDITLTLALASAWKNGSKLASYVMNGHAHCVMSGVALPAADDSVCMYAHVAGTAGNSLKVDVVDSGGVGPATYTYNAAGTELTIDYVGLTPSATVVTAGVNGAAGAIRAFVVGTGATNWTVAVAQTDLFGGSTACAALTTTDWGAGTGLTTVDTETRTFLAGVGSIAAVNTTFTDVLGIDALTLVGSKAIPGDKLIIWNGANKGCHEIDTIVSETVLTVTSVFSAIQANVLYTIMGTASEYGHLAADLISPGTDGDNFTITLAKNNAGTDVDVSIQVLEDSGATTILERFYDLSPISTNANYVQTIVNSDSEWADLDLFPQTIKCNGTGNSTAGDATFTDTAGVPATFIDDGVEDGDLFICTSATNAADVRVFEITAVTDNTHLEVNVNFTGTQADVVYTIVGDDATGAELLGLLASDVTITFAGGVDDVPEKSHYEGSSAARTGVYAIDNIPITSRPRKMWVPDAPIVVDGTGVDATDDLNISMASFCTSRQYLRYAYGNERGQTPAQMLVAVAADAMDSKYATEYVNWIKVSDPLTGNYKWTSPVGAMMGQADLFSAGAEGLVAPVANQPLLGVMDVENEIKESEEELLNNAHLNPIVKFNGIRNMGDYVRTSDTEWKWLHKRDVTIVTMQSIKNSLAQWANWQVKSLKTLGKIRKSVMGYLRKYDMRDLPIGGRFLNATDPSAEPYYVTCDTTNNNLGEPGIIVEIGFSIPEAVEEVTLRYGLWDGSVDVEEV